MWLKWLPWKYLLRRLARAHGFTDPIVVLSHLRRFAQPSEVGAPMELLRAGAIFHARGLINTGAIQHNLDWVWPYWIQRQFDPKDDAFIPRAFSITHVNLSHRNWTAVGVPDYDHLPIVDPCGLLTPFWDGWSLDAWIITDDKHELIPAHMKSVNQRLELASGLAITSSTQRDGLSLSSRTEVIVDNQNIICRQQLTAHADCHAWLAVMLRPYNCEGVSFISKAALHNSGRGWIINDKHHVEFSERVDRYQFSNYRYGDVRVQLPSTGDRDHVKCEVGMATAAAMFEIQPGATRDITVSIPLNKGILRLGHPSKQTYPNWKEALAGYAKLSVPDKHFQFLYEAALHALVLHSPGDIYAGPYTYKRFWFRDAAYIAHAMLCAGLTTRVERALNQFARRQTISGYFLSQDGEWDSNGEALWILHRFYELTGRPVKRELRDMIHKGAHWIINKRLSDTLSVPHAGLLPAGFSAEHLGPNDYYYWDDFWAIAGLDAAAKMIAELDNPGMAAQFREQSRQLRTAIERSLQLTAARRDRPGIPASPYRRMDGGAIGSIVASYPLQLYPANERRLLDTADFLLNKCFVDGGFFQDMIHSGINVYLTLHIAQVFLRAGDMRFAALVSNAAALASPTGQWPEAIHPRTRGGCMGDGQHMWAAAEWVMMMRNCFVREEDDRLILASGIFPAWLEGKHLMSFGPAPTPFGDISISIQPEADKVIINWKGDWRRAAPRIEVRCPGFDSIVAAADQQQVILQRRAS